MSAQAATNPQAESAEAEENGFYELSDEELHALVDLNARELVGISGEEFLKRLSRSKFRVHRRLARE